ncbi:MAG: THUMP domain-containing class I SAM-dependent RNA methyltransferase [Limnochordia bacterium]|jgi:putative N6-adenine-specific DNA methylase
MSTIELIATTTFGLEAVVKRELLALGYKDLVVEDGKITFTGNVADIPRANLWLRSADRVLLKMGSFSARSFEELFEGTKALPWDEWITRDGKFTVIGKSVKSQLFSVPDCQAIVKKAVVEKLKGKYKLEWFPETGPEYTIQVALLKDVATLTIDTSGVGLHKRGYRQSAGEAPLKETLAAALVQLSFWNKDRHLYDPFCGSGTIPIEAALIGLNIAPGLNRDFASQDWPQIGKELWRAAKVEAFEAIDQDSFLRIVGADIDPKVIAIAKENGMEAGVAEHIDFRVQDVAKTKFQDPYGVVITNPPYGARLGDQRELRQLYSQMGLVFREDPTWSVYVLTADEEFEEHYGQRAQRKRKLYNGNIKVDYYQFIGPRPPKDL